MRDLKSITLKISVKFFKYPSNKGCDTLCCKLTIFSPKVIVDHARCPLLSYTQQNTCEENIFVGNEIILCGFLLTLPLTA